MVESINGGDEAKASANDTSVEKLTLYREVKLGTKRCLTLLDTGSEVTLMPRNLADLSHLIKSTRKLRAANGSNIP